jgi:GMP synthase (glutamine-hydrolysing)
VKLIVLRAGDAAPPVAARRGEFFSWIRREGESAWPAPHEWVQHDVREVDVALPDPKDADCFIMTGSSSSVTERAPWMLRAEELLRRIVLDHKIPFFGICFGHQMLAEALGGKVAKNPFGREIGTIEVKMKSGVSADSDPILENLPTTFTANATHVDAVVTLPPNAKVLAETSLDPNAIYVIGDTAAKCVQFHPEFDGDSMRGYVEARAHLITAEGLDADAIHRRTVDTPQGADTLRNFLRFVRNRG